MIAPAVSKCHGVARDQSGECYGGTNFLEGDFGGVSGYASTGKPSYDQVDCFRVTSAGHRMARTRAPQAALLGSKHHSVQKLIYMQDEKPWTWHRTGTPYAARVVLC